MSCESIENILENIETPLIAADILPRLFPVSLHPFFLEQENEKKKKKGNCI